MTSALFHRCLIDSVHRMCVVSLILMKIPAGIKTYQAQFKPVLHINIVN